MKGTMNQHTYEPLLMELDGNNETTLGGVSLRTEPFDFRCSGRRAA